MAKAKAKAKSKVMTKAKTKKKATAKAKANGTITTQPVKGVKGGEAVCPECEETVTYTENGVQRHYHWLDKKNKIEIDMVVCEECNVPMVVDVVLPPQLRLL